MARYLIEVPHEAETVSCARAVKILLESGSHFLTHADFGCRGGDHRAWIVVDVDSADEARRIVPSAYRSRATVTALNRFTIGEMEEILAYHSASDSDARVT